MTRTRAAAAGVLALVVVLTFATGGSPASARASRSTAGVPKVVRLRLDKATATLKKAGFKSTKLVDRKGHRAVVRKTKWYVVDQSPRPGVVVKRGARVTLGVLKAGEKRRRAASVAQASAPSTSTPLPAPASTAGVVQAVRSVTDGDTIVLADGRRVRLAQVDAPEATSTTECYGAESTKALVGLVGGKSVTLRQPSNGPAKDRYGRTLAEVYVGGVSVNEALVRMGAAEWYDEFKSEDADLARRLQAAENEARQARRGLWSACATATATAPTTPRSTTPPATSPPTTAAPASTGNCDPAYPDDCIPPAPPDLNCSDIGRMVRVDHTYGDPHGFDRDNDGFGCESYA
jgi:micrococcal nuclease